MLSGERNDRAVRKFRIGLAGIDLPVEFRHADGTGRFDDRQKNDAVGRENRIGFAPFAGGIVFPDDIRLYRNDIGIFGVENGDIFGTAEKKRGESEEEESHRSSSATRKRICGVESESP